MEDLSALLINPEKHPFQIDNLPGPKGSFDITRMQSGFFVRLDMPGVPPGGIKIFKRSEKRMVTFNARAPSKESFPFDESERVYAGVVLLNRDPNEMLVDVIAENGSVILLFPYADGHLFFVPKPRYGPAQTSAVPGKSAQGEGSSDKPIDVAEAMLKLGLESNFEGSGISESGKVSSNESAEGSAKFKQGEGSSGKSIDKAQGKSSSGSPEGSAKNEQGKGSSSGKPINKAEGSGKPQQGKISSNEAAEAWMRACIKRIVLQINVPEPPEEESAPAETSPTGESSHEVPEIAIGSVKECSIHDPECQCQHCDPSGICLKTWSTTEDNFGQINRLKIKGPDGVCEKRVTQEEGWYSLYVRADLPGLEPHLCVTVVRDRCILVFGKPQPRERYIQGARNYLFFVQLRCSCCKFDNVYQDYSDGVLRLFCKIIGLNSGPRAD